MMSRERAAHDGSYARPYQQAEEHERERYPGKAHGEPTLSAVVGGTLAFAECSDPIGEIGDIIRRHLCGALARLRLTGFLAGC